MKGLITIIVFTFSSLLISCNQTEKQKPSVYKANYKDYELTQVQFMPYSIIFDTIFHGQSVTGHFFIKNVGKNKLYIDSVIKACSCTELSITKDTVNISDSLKVSFSIRPIVSNEYFVTPTQLLVNYRPCSNKKV